ncbi:hypothetical protein FA09DRAFT_41101 [Tilletiopsis washingtonensis]|uniref:Uncharacterized protein n=1 Tax=Tilletiopsis washingtonensis TaxID=58919 RepID=A0A316Z761_9BASI|nr:hypothetical protein FA09DRAFT_41101 [Tilletiopsis washingtonensis]PWN97617.1 hypothetical protein FA09DRAFT_41101 [Tilletiopsis washingtonensis]
MRGIEARACERLVSALRARGMLTGLAAGEAQDLVTPVQRLLHAVANGELVWLLRGRGCVFARLETKKGPDDHRQVAAPPLVSRLVARAAGIDREHSSWRAVRQSVAARRGRGLRGDDCLPLLERKAPKHLGSDARRGSQNVAKDTLEHLDLLLQPLPHALRRAALLLRALVGALTVGALADQADWVRAVTLVLLAVEAQGGECQSSGLSRQRMANVAASPQSPELGSRRRAAGTSAQLRGSPAASPVPARLRCATHKKHWSHALLTRLRFFCPSASAAADGPAMAGVPQAAACDEWLRARSS